MLSDALRGTQLKSTFFNGEAINSVSPGGAGSGGPQAARTLRAVNLLRGRGGVGGKQRGRRECEIVQVEHRLPLKLGSLAAGSTDGSAVPLGAWSRADNVIRPDALSPSSKKMLQGGGDDQNATCN